VLAYAISRDAGIAGLVAAIGALGAVMLGAVLLRGIVELLAWSLGMLGAAYALALVVRGSAVDERAPLVAIALLLCGELAAWSLDARWRIAAVGLVTWRRAFALGALALAGLTAAALAVAVAAAPAGRGLAWTTLGAMAAVAAVGVAVAVMRRAA
jgi:hypothetical protein